MSDDVLDAGSHALMQTWGTANERGWLTLTGLDPERTDALSAEEEDHLVLMISGMGDVAAWARGDYALRVRNRLRAQNYGHAQYNEQWRQEVDRLARRFAVAPKTLLNNISTCSLWPPEQRVAGRFVRYKHHEAIPSSIPLEDRLSMLRTAEENGWTWARLYAVAHGRLLPDGVQAGEMQKVADHVPVDVDRHLATMQAQEVDEIDLYVFPDDDDDVPYTMPKAETDWHTNDVVRTESDVPSGVRVVTDPTVRMTPPIVPLAPLTPSRGVSITLKDSALTSLILQESTDEALALYVSFDGALTYIVKPDPHTRTLTVSRRDD